MSETPAPKKALDLDHPCRETCSGWQQGYERGRAEGMKVAAKVAEEFLSHWGQGILERVNMGDATIEGIRTELMMHEALTRKLIKRLSGETCIDD